MFLVIDSGTTNSRAYLVQDHGGVLDYRSKKVGVRDTSITGSRDTLRNGLVSLVTELLSANDLVPTQIRFAIPKNSRPRHPKSKAVSQKTPIR